jgi:oligosaccharyltransferase complex subunit beta
MVSSSLLLITEGKGQCPYRYLIPPNPIFNLCASRWTNLYSATTAPVVPPRHDEYPRFLSAAWPYYAGAISTSVGFILFSALWLGGAVGEKGKKKE